MFVKHGDNTSTISFDKTAKMCKICSSEIISVNGNDVCLCSDDKKIKKLLTQAVIMTNNQETK